MGLEHSLPRKSPHSLCCLITSYGTIFPCFRLNAHSFVVLNHVWHRASGQTHGYMCPFGEEMGSFCWNTKGINHPVLTAGKDLLVLGGWCLLLELILHHLFSMWVKHCSIQHLIVLCFPWWLRLTMQWAEVLILLFLIVDSRCHLLNKVKGPFRLHYKSSSSPAPLPPSGSLFHVDGSDM